MPAIEKSEARALIEQRLRHYQDADWIELNEIILTPKIEELTTASGRRYRVKSRAWFDMEAWESGLYVDVYVYAERGLRRRWPYKGVTERGAPADPVPDPPADSGWVKNAEGWQHPAL